MPSPEPTEVDPREHAESTRWLLSFYRVSEISGALFFGRLARSRKPGPLQRDLTRHFADEAQHARWWTDAIEALDIEPIKMRGAYQDQYLAATGIPANMMEVLAVTSVFERRVVGQYARHLRTPELHPVVASTLHRIIEDERWHLQWVREALRGMEPQYGREYVQDTLQRMVNADQEVYEATLREHSEHVALLLGTGADSLGSEDLL